MQQNLARGIDLFTDYSGAGAIENAAESISVFMEDSKHVVAGGGFRTMRATDFKPLCQKVLRQSTGQAAPKCIFNDITERVSPEDLKCLQDIERESRRMAELQDVSSQSHRKAVLSIGKEMVSAMAAFLLHVQFLDQQHCTRHDKP